MTIEISLTPRSKVAEVRRFDGDVVIEHLGPDSEFAASQQGRWLPVRPEDVRRWLVAENSSDILDWKHRLAEWAKGLAPSEGNGACRRSNVPPCPVDTTRV